MLPEDGKAKVLSAYDTAGPLSRFFLVWMNSMMGDSMRGQSLALEDLPPLPIEDTASHQMLKAKQKLERFKERKKDGRNFFKLLFRLHGLSFTTGALCAFGMGIVRIGQNILVGQLLTLDIRNPNFKLNVYLIAAGIAAFSFAEALFIHQWTISVRCAGLRARTTCAILAYNRILQWKKSDCSQISTGQIINLFGNDIGVFDERIRFLPLVIIAPIELVLNLGVMWWLIGWYSAVGIGFLLVCLFFQVLMGKAFAALRRKANLRTDERIQLTTDVLNGIKLIKMYAWEWPMQKLIISIRNLEMMYVTRCMMLRAVMAGIFNMTGRMAFFLILLPYVLCGNRLRPELIFTMTTFCYVLRAVAGYLFQSGVAVAAETYVAIKRIGVFLGLNEEEEKSGKKKAQISEDRIEIITKNLMCNWEQKITEDFSGGVSFVSKPGEIIALVGPVGSGKTTILMALMGELSTFNDAVETRGKIAYVPQEAWVFAGTVQDNIVFGAPFDEQRFQKAVEVCALTEDLKGFSNGRHTMVGQKGTMLSGGQKARINLARAVYADADIYLLDDPLSAVDSKVCQHLFEKCIRKQLNDKIIVLATHQVQFLHQVDSIILLDKGLCTGQGSHKDLNDSGVHFTHTGNQSNDNNEPECKAVLPTTNSDEDPSPEIAIVPDPLMQSTMELPTMAVIDSKDFVATGFVSWRVHWEYMTKDSGVILFLFLLVFVVLFQGLGVGVDYWLKYWVEHDKETLSTISNSTSIFDSTVSLTCTNFISDNRRLQYLYRYIYLLVGCLATTIIALILGSFVCQWASVGYHSRLLTSILRAKPHYFDIQPIGNFQNRFSCDMADIDYNLPMSLFDVFVMTGGCIAPLVLTCILNYWLTIPAVILVVFYCKMTIVHLRACGNLKRLEGVARSPLYSHVTNTIIGLPVIHAMGKEEVMMSVFEEHLDRYSSAVYHYICANCWVTGKIQMADSFYVGVVIFVMAFFYDGSHRETIGLVMTLTFMLMPLLWWNIIRVGEAEDQLTAIERIKNYIQLEAEKSLKSKPESQLPDSWPEKGNITMDNVQAIYPVVNKIALDGLTFHIKNGEKIGIVGRTGAGKSSLVTTIFRLMEPTSGSIVIDGVLVNEIGLHDLRSKLSVIPQEPIMFAGSVRYNLDPFGEHPDDHLMAALDEVSMKQTVCSMTGGLDADVREGGSAFSIGERQLICIARAILRNNKILLLDEATANIDNKMDALIQTTIRRKFENCTVLTVAHRLSTIIDYDRVMVLDKGKIVEFDEPHILLNMKSGHFYNLIKSSGPKCQIVLTQMAKDAYNLRHINQLN